MSLRPALLLPLLGSILFLSLLVPHRGLAAPTVTYTVTMRGTAVRFDMSGFEPDFDPIYRLVVSATVHDNRPGSSALPDSTLVLDAYMEVFQPDTTPVLPDLLHPNQVATNLAGFLSGKAALVNAGGHVVYQGSLLAEIFQNNAEHLVVDLSPLGQSTTTVRLEGPITLLRGGAEHGTMTVLQPLSSTLLAVPHGRAPSWQSVVNGMTVAKPIMMGTAAPAGAHRPAKPSTIAPLSLQQQGSSASACTLLCRVRRPIILAPMALGAVLVLAGLVLARPRRCRLPS